MMKFWRVVSMFSAIIQRLNPETATWLVRGNNRNALRLFFN